MSSKPLDFREKTTEMWKSSSEEAAERILSMIQENAWPYGHKLPSQRALAEALGISRPTVREALVALETMRIFQNGKQLVNEDNTPYEIASPYTSDMHI